MNPFFAWTDRRTARTLRSLSCSPSSAGTSPPGPLRFEERPDDPALAADGRTARLFDLVLVDEASQALVSQGLISLAGLAADGRVIVCGDDRQLAPVRTASEAAGGGRELAGSLYRFLASAGVRQAALEDTFRLNGPLVEFPAREFYDGRFFSAVPDLPRRARLLRRSTVTRFQQHPSRAPL